MFACDSNGEIHAMKYQHTGNVVSGRVLMSVVFFFSFGLVIVSKQTTQSQNKNRSQRQREEEKREKKHGRKQSAFTLHTYTYTHTLTQTRALFLSQREIGLISIYTNTNVFFGLFSVVRLLS